mmetsp:Transcript_60856/g.170580  ORF Transcript_60856/g.170580 Transcript_60856/m.170580 type:complete len:248 (+) Transcript_60856:54-797(+)
MDNAGDRCRHSSWVGLAHNGPSRRSRSRPTLLQHGVGGRPTAEADDDADGEDHHPGELGRVLQPGDLRRRRGLLLGPDLLEVLLRQSPQPLHDLLGLLLGLALAALHLQLLARDHALRLQHLLQEALVFCAPQFPVEPDEGDALLHHLGEGRLGLPLLRRHELQGARQSAVAHDAQAHRLLQVPEATAEQLHLYDVPHRLGHQLPHGPQVRQSHRQQPQEDAEHEGVGRREGRDAQEREALAAADGH